VSGGIQRGNQMQLARRIACAATLLSGLVALVLAWAVPSQAQSIPTHTESTVARSSAPVSDEIPVGAQSVVSATLGNSDQRYRAKASAAGYATENPANHLAAQYSTNGVEFQSQNANLDFVFQSWGYGHRRVKDIKVPIAPVVNANRVEYRRGALTEWYVNGPLGLEQGFTISRPPTTPSDSHHDGLNIVLRLGGNLTACVEPGRHALILRDQNGAQALRYGPLLAYDVSGRELESWMDVQDGNLRLRVNTAGARYPITVDPWVQAVELTNPLGSAGDYLGRSVAISGNTIVVGAPFAKVGGNADEGAAYVFVKPSNGWSTITTYNAELINNNGAAQDNFGSSVAISGSTIVVGAPVATSTKQGAAYVFVEPFSGVWTTPTTTPTYNAELIASTGVDGDLFGYSVGISGDTIVVGAAGADGYQGAAYVFVEPTSGVWTTPEGSPTYNTELTASNAADGDEFGYSVAINENGNTIAVGAPNVSSGSNTTQGAAYVFVEPTSGGWAAPTAPIPFSAELFASDGATGDSLGDSVAISGNTVVAGAPRAQIGLNLAQGAAYVFAEPAGGWLSLQYDDAKLTASSGTSSTSLGNSVGISGNTIVAGAQGVSIGPNSATGAAYLFVEPTAAGGWASAPSENQTAELTATVEGSEDFLGYSVGISNNTVVAGAPGVTIASKAFQGAAYVFTDGAPTVSPTPLIFGDVAVNETSAAQTVTVTNTSPTATITMSALDIPAGTAFAFGPTPSSGTLCTSTLVLTPSQSCVFSVEFTPSVLGPATGALTIQSTDGTNQFSEVVNLSGTGVELDIAIFSTGAGGFAFSSVPVGSTSIATPFTLTNEGPSPMSVSLITISTNIQSAPYPNQFFLSSASCALSSIPLGASPIYSVSSFTIAAGDICTFTLGFTPEVAGPVSGQIAFAETAASSNICGGASLASCTTLSNNLLEEIIPLAGTGTGAPAISVSQLSLNFPNQPLGVPVASPPINLVNIGNVPLYFAGVGIAPASPNFADFTDATTCSTSTPLAPFPANGNSCTITVTFTPSTTTGQESASIFLTDNAVSPNPTSIPLTGTGVAAGPTLTSIQVSPSNPAIAVNGSQQFTAAGTFSDGSMTNPLTGVTWSVTNATPAGVATINSGTGLAMAGASAGSATIVAAEGGISGSTTLTVAVPVGPDSEPILVTDFDTVTPLINVSAPAAFFSTNSLGFGNVAAGTSGTQTITVSNIGQGQTGLTLTSAVIPSGTPFSLGSIICSNGDSSLPATLPSGGACLISVTYQAPESGSANATLTFTDNAALSNLTSTLLSGSNYTQTISLLGNGTTAAAPPPPPATVDVTDNETITVTDSPQAQASGCPAITVSPSGTLSPATFGVAYSQQFSATGGATPLGWSATSAPSWLNLNPNSGLLSGTPTATGTFPFSVTATDKNTCTGSASVSLTVAPKPTATTTAIKSAASSDNGNPLPANTALIENPITVSFTVLPSSGNATATGTVKVTDGVSASDGCSTTLTAGAGSCAITISPTASASTPLTAAYTPDATATGLGLLASTSAAFTETITEIDNCGTLPASQTVTQGAASTFTFSICLAGNVQAAATAAVTGCPPSAQCSDTVTPVAGAPGVYTIAVTITTGSAGRIAPLEDRRPWNKPWPFALFAFGVLLAMLMALRMAQQNRERARLAYGAGMLVALLLVVSGISGCLRAGGTNTATPPNIYTVDVSITAGTVNIVVPLNLTVTK
jgi:hypothetical protein